MEYTVNELATISNVSVRTLHYYDEIDLLHPMRVAKNGYRIYGQKEVDLLQQILFYRELGVPLKKINKILNTTGFDREKELENQLSALLQRKNQIELLITNVKKTINSLKGEDAMSDIEKFKGFKRNLIEENERKYGKEILEKYGDEAVKESYAKLMDLSEEEYKKMESLAASIKEALEDAVRNELSPAGERGNEIASMHKEWLSYSWKKYSKETHKNLGAMYVADDRFTAYYDDKVKGCAAFLRDAIAAYCSN